jgi:dienelactone hydrolase
MDTKHGFFGSRVIGPLASSVDHVISRAITGRSSSSRQRSRAESLGPRERAVGLRRIAEIYDAAAPLEELDGFFGAPSACEPKLTRVGHRRVGPSRIEVFDATWRSRITTYCDDPELASRFGQMTQNHDAAARLFLGPDRSRPAVILIHGYRAGQFAIEERVWPTSWLLERGFDVALFVLPFHAVRAEPRSAPRFPNSDPRFTNEAFRQAIHDLRALHRFFRERGASAVGAMGMSLGGYTTSLLATVDALDFAALMIPLASFADVALASNRLVGTDDEQREQHALLERAHLVVSPFARTSKVDKDAMIVVAGAGDRITPLAHAERLAAHFGSEMFTFPGGHLLQYGRSDGFRAIGRMLGRRGLFSARGSSGT